MLSVLMYGCQSWTIKKNKRVRIKEVSVADCWGIMDCEEDKRVLETARVGRILLGLIKQRKLSSFAQVLWKSGNCLEEEIIQGIFQGPRAQGRSVLIT